MTYISGNKFFREVQSKLKSYYISANYAMLLASKVGQTLQEKRIFPSPSLTIVFYLLAL